MERVLTENGAKRGQPERWTRSTCPYCGVGCGVEVGVRDGRMVAIRGDKAHPANFGKLCPKPAGLPDAVHHRDRLTHPLRRRGGRLERVSWDEALKEVSARIRGVLRESGPGALAFYISGQLLTEDYYVVNKLARGYLGTGNLDSNSRLCMSSAVAGYAGAFGTDGPPAAYADISHSECIVLWGSNTADCHPVTFDRIRRRKKDPKASVVVVDPRRTPTAEAADVFLQIRPGTDLALANAMLRVLLDEGFVDGEFIWRHTTGFAETAEVAREWIPQRAARECGIEAEEIVEAARRFGEAKAAMILWTMGVNQSTVGTRKNRALINLCLATGNVGKVGAGPFSLTGQPNAMGGRETGGLAHLLPGYRLLENAAHRREVEEAWGLPEGRIPAKPGLPATDLFRAVDNGAVELLWVVATNPAVSMPHLARVKRALRNAFVVVQDAYPTETTRYADVVLPAAGWGEKTGTMTNSERRVSLVEKVVEPPGEARPDWEIFADMGRRMGFDGFAWADSAEVYEEYKELTRDTPVDVTGLSHERLRRGPAQWPVPERIEHAERPVEGIVSMWDRLDTEHPGTPRLYVDKRFNTPNRRARFAPTPHVGLKETPDGEYPLVLSTGRVKNQWHTMTRTGRSEKLMRGLEGGPFVELHPEAANAAGVRNGETVRVVSKRGEFLARAAVTEGIEIGTAFVPFHWGDFWTESGSVNEATHPAADPVSKQPELKGAAVRIEPADAGG
ncbi:MAG: nitrate reductase, partial [Actinomycetota bacterium]